MRKEVSVPYVDCQQSAMLIAELHLVRKGSKHGDREYPVLHVELKVLLQNECYDNDVKAIRCSVGIE